MSAINSCFSDKHQLRELKDSSTSYSSRKRETTMISFVKTRISLDTHIRDKQIKTSYGSYNPPSRSDIQYSRVKKSTDPVCAQIKFN